MNFKVTLVVVMALLVGGLIWLNQPHSPVTTPPAPSESQSSLPKLPKHFLGTAQREPDEPQSTNLFHQVKDGEFPKLTAAQVEAYLLANHRNAESLVAAMQVTGDRAFLKEALEKFPNDPKVNFAALFLGNPSPEEARKLADNYKRVDPNNPMADYASALNYFKSGQTDLALQDMAAGAGKGQWNDYSKEFMESSEEAYRSAGYSAVDAEAFGQGGLQLGDLAPLKKLSLDLASQASAFQKAGDSASAQSILQMDMRLGQQLTATDAQPLITSLVGIAVQRIAYDGMDPNAVYGNSGQTVQEQIAQLQQQRKDINTLVNQGLSLRPLMSDDDYFTYLQRRQSFGELNAMQWVINKYGPH